MKKRLLGLMAAVFALAASAFAFSACDLGDKDNSGGNNDDTSGGEHSVHSYTEKNTDDKYLKSEATCKNKAVYYFSCSCGEKGKTTFEYGELAEHTEVIDKAVEPTCTTAGKTAGKHCSVCNKVLVEQTEIKAKGHTPVTDEAVEPTCTTAGKTAGKHCSVCKEPLEGLETIPANGHTPVTDEAVPATCTTAGKTEGSHCSVCKKVLVAQKTIPAGHKYETETVAATQTAHGSAKYTCSGCGDTYTEVLHNIVYGVCTVCHGSKAAVRYKYYFLNGEKYYQVSGLNDKTVTGIIILPTYNDGVHGELPVTSIGEGAFYGCSGLTSIEIPNSVTSIDNSAFSGCSGLTGIYFTGNIADWCKISGLYNLMDYGVSGKKLFISGQEITGELIIPNDVTSIGNDAFSGCSSLTSVVIPDSVTSIGSDAFYNCSGLTSIEIPDSVTIIGDRAFSGCSGLTSIVIPDDVKSIGQKVFYNCSGLTSITIPDGVTSIGNSAFYGCSGLTNIVIPDSVTSIGNSAFYGCSGLTSITVGEGNQNYASQDGILYNKAKTKFEHIPKAISGAVTIPDGVTSIGSGAFYGCSGLTSIVIPDSVTSIDGGAFYNCGGLTSIVIPDSVTSIGEWAFDGCSGLTSVTIGNGVTSIGDDAFRNCTRIESATLPTFAISYIPKNSLLKTVVITSGESIDDKAFLGCSGLTSIEIHDSVTNIGGWAFEGCSGLTSIEIPDGVTGIGNYAFLGCSGLKSIVISDSVTSIGVGAFYDCIGLTSISVGAENETYKRVDNCLLTKDGKTLVLGIKNSVIPNSVTSIRDGAFYGCSGLTSITIPDSVTSIGRQAFYNCNGLTSIEIPSSVTSIGGSAFSGCSSLTIYCKAAEKPSGWNNDWNSSNYCPVVWSCKTNDKASNGNIYTVVGGVRYALKDGVATVARQSQAISGEVVIPSTVEYKGTNYAVTSVVDGAFSGCSGLTGELIIPDGVTSIGFGAFYGCSGLTSIIIPDGVASIGERAFENCSGLTIYCEAAEKPEGWNNNWNSSNCPVVWSCQTDDIANDGNVYTVASGVRYAIKDGVATVARQSQAISGEVVIPSTVEYKGTNYAVTSIGENAFQGCSGLTSVTITDGVTSIGGNAFEGCSGLTSIYFTGNIADWCKISGLYWLMGYGVSGKKLFIDGQEIIGELIIPNDVTSIGEYAFYGCSGLTSIVIPNSVTSIGRQAFYNCSGLTSIIIPDSVTNIGSWAFGGCSGLTSIVIPDSVTNIGSWAFNGCTGLTSIVIPDSVTSIDSWAFADCSGLTIYCEATEKPSGWSSFWNYSNWNESNCLVVWGYTGNN